MPRQLPLAARGFVGRTKHLAELDALLQADSVVISALDGTAGIGKTTLAVHWAHRVQHHFPDGTLHTNLRGYGPGDPATPAEVLDEFLLALGIPPERVPTGTEAKAALFRSVLAGKRVLMVLDNANAVSQVRPLLPGSPGCLVLITSRASLTGLVVNDGAHRVTLDLLTMEEATNLVRDVLGERADAEPTATTELIRQCANLPLALRVAAGRAATQPHLDVAGLVADIADDQRRWEALTVPGDEDTAVRAVFDWSYHRLSVEQARVFRRLGLHPGPDMSLHAATAVTGCSPFQTRRVLDALADVHLIEPISQHRYRFHDLLRVYAADRAEAEDTDDDREAARKGLTTWYARHSYAAVALVNPAIVDWKSRETRKNLGINEPIFTTSTEAVSWIDTERANLIACTHQAINNEQPSLAFSIAMSNAQIFERMGYRDDMLHMCRLALDCSRSMADRSAEARALSICCNMHTSAQQWRKATEYGLAALECSHELDDKHVEANALNGLGLVHLGQGQLIAAREYLETALPLSGGAQRGRLEALIEAQGMESHADAIEVCEKALEPEADRQYPITKARILDIMGTSLQRLGRALPAMECWRGALPIYESHADPRAEELRQLLSDMQAPPSTPDQ